MKQVTIMENGKIGCQRKDGSLRLHFDTAEQAQACIDKYGWNEEPVLCHCGYYHAERATEEALN
jgi:hypothetical protein